MLHEVTQHLKWMHGALCPICLLVKAIRAMPSHIMQLLAAACRIVASASRPWWQRCKSLVM